MSQDWRIFVQGVTAALRTQNGQNLAQWLQITGGDSQSALAQLAYQLQGTDVNSLFRNQPQLNDPTFGPVISGMLMAAISVAVNDFEGGKLAIFFTLHLEDLLTSLVPYTFCFFFVPD